MIKVSIVSELTDILFKQISHLWMLTEIGNPARSDTFEAVTQTLKNGGKIILVYEDDLAVGTVWLTHDFRRLFIHHMAVHPDYRTKGFGKLLMQEAVKYARELNLQAKLEVHKDNDVALKLYQSFGFEILDGYVLMIKRDI